nr:unnamed protein product [Callosobruchus chinensis]
MLMIIQCIKVPGSILFLALFSILFIALNDLSTDAVVTGMTRRISQSFCSSLYFGF